MISSNRVCTALMLGTLTVFLAACEVTSGRETTGQYIDDTTISTKVRDKMVDDPVTSPFEIGVETMKGVVQLSGFVASSDIRRAAEKDAMSVQGVNDVRDDIVVR